LLVLLFVFDGRVEDLWFRGQRTNSSGCRFLRRLLLVGRRARFTTRPPPDEPRTEGAKERDRAAVEGAKADTGADHDGDDEQRQQHHERTSDADGLVEAAADHRAQPPAGVREMFRRVVQMRSSPG